MLKKTLILVFFLSVSLHAKSAELAVIEKSLAVMGVPPKALNKAVDYINKNKSKVKNKRYITFINCLGIILRWLFSQSFTLNSS